jgi:hypothetical protein
MARTCHVLPPVWKERRQMPPSLRAEPAAATERLMREVEVTAHLATVLFVGERA